MSLFQSLNIIAYHHCYDYETINAQRKAINRKNARIQQEDNSKINKVPGLNLEEARLMPLPCQMSPSSIEIKY